MKFKSTFLFLLLLLRLNSNNRLDIFLSLNECVNCYAALNTLSSLHNYQTRIFIARRDSLAAGEFLENYSLSNISYQYVSRSASYLSYCKVTVNNQLADSFGLQQLPHKLAQLNTLVKNTASELRVFYLPQNTVFKNDRLDISVADNRLGVYDYILNKNVLFNVDDTKDTLQKALELKGSQFSPKLFLTAARFDSSLYYRCSDLLKRKGKSAAHFEGSFLNDSSLYILLNFPWVRISPQNPNDTIIASSYFLYQRNLFSGEKKLSFINDAALKQNYNYRYTIDNSRPFFIDHTTGKAAFSLLDYTRPDNNLYVLADFHPQKNHYDFEQLNAMKFDKDFYAANLLDNYSILLNRQFYFSIKLKLLIDYRNQKILQLSGFDLPETAFGADLCSTANGIQLLVLNKKEVQIVYFDHNGKKTATGKKYTLPPDCSVTSLKFYDDSTLVFFDTGLTRLYKMSLND